MKTRALRWTINRAAAEFGISKDTIKRGLNREGIEAAKDYSTAEIFRAIGGDFRYESTRRQRAEADRLERENKLATGDTVTIAQAAALFGAKIAALVQPLDSLPSLVPGLSLAQRQVLVTKIEACKEAARNTTSNPESSR